MASSPFKAVLQRTGSSNDDSNAEESLTIEVCFSSFLSAKT
jgi:hypothetical protein